MRTYERSWWWVKQKKQMALVFITVTMILQFQMKGCVGCVETERIGLLQLKSYLNSLFSPQGGSILKSWSDDDPKSDCCSWESVQCSDATGGHIIDLSLEFVYYLDQPRGLNISLFHSFPQLKTLDLSSNNFNHLFDPIHGHRSSQRLENLETLDLWNNLLNNSVLPFLSAATSLRTLNLGSNRLEGIFPLNGLINCRELEELDLSENWISNFEAGDGLRMTKLKKLDLSHNEFSDTSQLKGLVFPPSLQVLILEENELSLSHEGYSKLCGLMNLRELDLSSNALTSMPNCLATSLRTLNLQSNKLDGVFPQNGYKSFQRLETLDLSENLLNNSVLPFLSATTLLRTLNLRGNRLKGVFPPNGLINFRELEELDLSFNSINDFEAGDGEKNDIVVFWHPLYALFFSFFGSFKCFPCLFRSLGAMEHGLALQRTIGSKGTNLERKSRRIASEHVLARMP